MSVSTNTGVEVDNKPTKKLGKGFKYAMCLLLVVVLSGAVAIAASILIVRHRENGPKCSDSVLSAAVPNFDPNKISLLQDNVGQIVTIKNYKRDPNCVYVVLTYYINVSNAKIARAELNDFKAVYNPKKGLNKVLGNVSLNTLEAKVAKLEKDYIPNQPEPYIDKKTGRTILINGLL